MEWSGRAPAPPAIDADQGTQDKELVMSQMGLPRRLSDVRGMSA